MVLRNVKLGDNNANINVIVPHVTLNFPNAPGAS